jgi:uncharacterized protein
MIPRSSWLLAYSLLLTFALPGCRSLTPGVTHYTLSPIRAETVEGVVAGDPMVAIGLLAVELPRYVNRLQMVIRTGPHQLEIASWHRWADYPDRLVQAILVENLQMLLPHTRIAPMPWPIGPNPDLSLSFQFVEWVATADGEVRLSAVWTLFGADRHAMVQSDRVTLTEPLAGSGFDELAASHSRALEALCREVAQSLNDQGFIRR